MSPTVLHAARRGPASLVRALVACTATVPLGSPARATAGAISAFDGGPRSSFVRSTVSRVWRTVRGHGQSEPPLAARRLALPPADLEIVLAPRGDARQREPSGPPTGARRRDPGVQRPVWVRRLDEWAEPARSGDVAVRFEDEWEELESADRE